jgi:autotransporter-associated beta strand protein
MKKLIHPFAAALATVLLATSAPAASYTWSGPAGGTWDVTATNWSTGAAWDSVNGPGNAAVFNTASLSATVSGTVYTNGITFNQTTTLNGGTITLSGTTPTVALGASGNSSTIKSLLAGTSGVTVSATGAEDLYVGGNNSGLSGSWQIGAGVRVLAESNNAFGSGDVYVDSTAANVDLGINGPGITVANNFHIQGAHQGGAIFMRNSTVNGSIDLLGSATIAGYGTDILGGVISNSATANLTFDLQNTSGALIKLGNANTYTGTTTLQNATNATGLILANANALQNSTLLTASNQVIFDKGVSGHAFTLGGLGAASGTLALQDNATTPDPVALSIGNNNASTNFGGTLSGSGSLTKIGTGTLTLSGSNSYAGGTIVAAGVLSLGNLAALSGGGNIAFGGGTLQFSTSNTADYSARIQSSAGPITIDSNGQSVTFASPLVSSNTGGLTKLGTGTLVLSGSNGYTGATTLGLGTLSLGSPGAVPAGSTIVFGGGTLQYTAANALDNSGQFSTAANQAYSFDTNNQSVTLGGNLGSSGGSLAKGGLGTLTLTGSNSYSGTTTIAAGTLLVS